MVVTEMCAEWEILQLTCALWWTNYVLETLFLKYLELTFGISVLTFLVSHWPIL